MVGRKSLDAWIRLYALQNVLLALLALVLAEGERHLVLAGVALLLIKGVLITRYMFWLQERLGISHEVETYLSIPLSLLQGVV